MNQNRNSLLNHFIIKTSEIVMRSLYFNSNSMKLIFLDDSQQIAFDSGRDSLLSDNNDMTKNMLQLNCNVLSIGENIEIWSNY